MSRPLLDDLRRMIEETRQGVAATVNTALTLLYWRIGKRIREEILKGERAEYGEQIVSTLSRLLMTEYGSGFSAKNIHHMMHFFEAFPNEPIVSTLSRQLSWSHFKEIIYLKLPLQKDFYAEMCRIERWSVRTLRQKIASMLYERTALSKKPEELARIELDALRDEDRLTPDLVFRDPYFLDFLGLTGAFQEKDLEAAIIREMEAFILELGIGFSFVARQKRITVDEDDFYLDLLFFHRDLRRLVAIELKLDKFRPEHKGQMELYLRWLDRYERKQGEQAPLGMILCAGKKEEQIELLELGSSGIHVAEYLTSLPPKELLREKLHRAIVLARGRLEMSGAAASQCSNCSERGEESRSGERRSREEQIAENVVKLLEGK
ncbi:MAG: PDDEXK nuclease domain-containing protein [Coprothermobacterota bacterium]|nr:PDDEXK nuclease domain-containing protein [Coprothermobacterota bacterium]